MSLVERYVPRYTVKDYRRWEGDWELIEGIAYAMAPSPFGVHQKLVMEIGRQIANQLKDCSEPCSVYPDLDWIIDEETVLRPDLMVVCKDVPEYLKEPPEVVIEVVSSNTAYKDEVLKFSIYEREKVRFYCLVYPDIKKIRIFEFKNDRYEKVFDSDSGVFEFRLHRGCIFTIEPQKIF